MIKNKKRLIKSTSGERVFDIFNTCFMLVLCFIMLFPFWYVLIYSFNEGRDAALGGIWFFPRKFTVTNYQYVLGNPYITNAYFITIARTVCGAVIHLLVTGFAAYALSKKDLPFRKGIIYFYMIPMFIGGTLVSSYVVMAKLKLLNNFLIYVLPGAFGFFMMVIIRTFFEQLPEALEESAYMDGAGYMTIFFRITLPLSGPIVATTVFFSAIGHWLDFYTSLIYITKPALQTLQYVLYKIIIDNETAEIMKQLDTTALKETLGSTSTVITTQVLKMTTLVVVTFPLLFVYPFFQKYFIKGVLIGAVKA